MNDKAGKAYDLAIDDKKTTPGYYKTMGAISQSIKGKLGALKGKPQFKEGDTPTHTANIMNDINYEPVASALKANRHHSPCNQAKALFEASLKVLLDMDWPLLDKIPKWQSRNAEAEFKAKFKQIEDEIEKEKATARFNINAAEKD